MISATAILQSPFFCVCVDCTQYFHIQVRQNRIASALSAVHLMRLPIECTRSSLWKSSRRSTVELAARFREIGRTSLLLARREAEWPRCVLRAPVYCVAIPFVQYQYYRVLLSLRLSEDDIDIKELCSEHLFRPRVLVDLATRQHIGIQALHSRHPLFSVRRFQSVLGSVLAPCPRKSAST